MVMHSLVDSEMCPDPRQHSNGTAWSGLYKYLLNDFKDEHPSVLQLLSPGLGHSSATDGELLKNGSLQVT